MATAAGPGQPVTGPAVAAEQVPLRRNRDFNLLWGGQAVSLLGTQMSVIAYPLLILTVTGSAAQAGIVSGATLIGTVALLLPAGVVADRYPRKRILMITSLAQMIAVATVVPAGLTHRVYLAHLAAVGLTQGVASAFYIGASRGAVRRIVPAIQLPHALSRLFARDQAAALLGPPIGGALFGVAQFLPFACDSASFGAVATAAALLRGPLDPAAEAADGSNAVPRVPIRRAVTNGMRYLIGQPFLRTVAIWSAAVNAVAAAMLLMVIVLARSRGATPLVIGGMFSVNAACGLAGVAAARLRGRHRVRAVGVVDRVARRGDHVHRDAGERELPGAGDANHPGSDAGPGRQRATAFRDQPDVARTAERGRPDRRHRPGRGHPGRGRALCDHRGVAAVQRGLAPAR